jgi:hypothetical protein
VPAFNGLAKDQYVNGFLKICEGYASKKSLVCPQAPDAGAVVLGKCCAHHVEGEFCEQAILWCEDLDTFSESELGVSKEHFEKGCDAYCDEVSSKPDWCPSEPSAGLSAGAIAGIVIACVVVVGAVAAVRGGGCIVVQSSPCTIL